MNVPPRVQYGPPPSGGLLEQANIRQLSIAVTLLVLAGFSSLVFLLNLAPVYGALPPHIFHNYGAGLAAICGYFLRVRFSRTSIRRAAYLLPVIACWIPTAQYFFLQGASVFGNPVGPLITDVFVLYPLIVLTAGCVRELIQSALKLERYGELVSDHAPFLGLYTVYSMGERIANFFISHFLGSAVLFSRTGLQFLIGILYAVALPSKLLVLAIPSLLFSLSFNVHIPFSHSLSSLNSAIQDEGFVLLARQDSVTGYISVLDNLEEKYRVMRCDHSLLGGQWIGLPNEHHSVKDPVYAVFTMMEAVRLVENDQGQARPDAGSSALVIGLGAGTTPAALINHGIQTTIVEIDPVVHRFATEYFHLPSNHIAVIEDATKFVRRQKSYNTVQYDYIIHDVFTGGAEPIELFTVEFFRDLDSLLKHDGVIAINYAGDISLYPAALIVRTIQAVFPTCRIFREDITTQENPNFTNMVVFCKKSTATPLRFREPTDADFFGSGIRETHLVPKHEIDAHQFQKIPEKGLPVLPAKRIEGLAHHRDRSAIAHWNIMRTVLPQHIWMYW